MTRKSRKPRGQGKLALTPEDADRQPPGKQHITRTMHRLVMATKPVARPPRERGG